MAMIKIEGRGEVSEETIKQALDEKFGPKKSEFEPIKRDFVTVGVSPDSDIYIKIRANSRRTSYPIDIQEIGCWLYPAEAKDIASAINSAIAFGDK